MTRLCCPQTGQCPRQGQSGSLSDSVQLRHSKLNQQLSSNGDGSSGCISPDVAVAVPPPLRSPARASCSDKSCSSCPLAIRARRSAPLALRFSEQALYLPSCC